MTFNEGDIVEIVERSPGSGERAARFLHSQARVVDGRMVGFLVEDQHHETRLQPLQARPDGHGLSEFFWRTQHLRLVTPAPCTETETSQMPTETDPAPTTHPSGFAVGDKVRTTRLWDGVDAGTVGEVVELDNTEYHRQPNFVVRWDSDQDGGWFADGRYIVRDSAFGVFAPVAPPPAPVPHQRHASGFAIGDRVRAPQGYAGLSPGVTGTVSRLAPDSLAVKFDGRITGGLYGNGEYVVQGAAYRRFERLDGTEPVADSAEPVADSPEPEPTFEVGSKVVAKPISECAANHALYPEMFGVELTVTARRFANIIDITAPDGRRFGGWHTERFTPVATPAPAPEPEPEPDPEPLADWERALLGHDLDQIVVGSRVVLKSEVEYAGNGSAVRPPSLRHGVVYTVADIYSSGSLVDLDGPDGSRAGDGFFTERFKLAPAAPAFSIGEPEPDPEPLADWERALLGHDLDQIVVGSRVVLKTLEEYPENAGAPYSVRSAEPGTVFTVSGVHPLTAGGDAMLDLEDVGNGYFSARFKLAPAEPPAPAPTFSVGDRVLFVDGDHAEDAFGKVGVITRLGPSPSDVYDRPHPYRVRLDDGETWDAATVEHEPEPAPEPVEQSFTLMISVDGLGFDLTVRATSRDEAISKVNTHLSRM